MLINIIFRTSFFYIYISVNIKTMSRNTDNSIASFLMRHPYIIYMSGPTILSIIGSLSTGESIDEALGRMALNVATFEGISSSVLFSIAMIGMPSFVDFCSMAPFFNKTICLSIYIFFTYITCYVTYNVYRIFNSGTKLATAKVLDQTSKLLKFFSDTSKDFLDNVVSHLDVIDNATGSRRVELIGDVINDIQLVFNQNAQKTIGFLFYAIAFSSNDKSTYYNFLNLLSSLVRQDPNNDFYKGLMSNYESTKKLLQDEINKKMNSIKSNLREKVDGLVSYVVKASKRLISKDKELADVVFEDIQTKNYYDEDEAIDLIDNIETNIKSKVSGKELELVNKDLKQLQLYKSEIIEYKIQYEKVTEYKKAVVGFVENLSTLSFAKFEQNAVELMSLVEFSKESGDFFINPSSLFSDIPQVSSQKRGFTDLIKSPYTALKQVSQLLTGKNTYEQATNQGLKAIDSIIDMFTKAEFVDKTKAWKSFVNKDKTQLMFKKIKDNYKMLMDEGFADYREFVYEKGLELKRTVELEDILPSSQYLEYTPNIVTTAVTTVGEYTRPVTKAIGEYTIPIQQPLFTDIPSSSLIAPDIHEINLSSLVQVSFLVIILSILLRFFTIAAKVTKQVKKKKKTNTELVPLQEQGQFYFDFHKHLA